MNLSSRWGHKYKNNRWLKKKELRYMLNMDNFQVFYQRFLSIWERPRSMLLIRCNKQWSTSISLISKQETWKTINNHKDIGLRTNSRILKQILGSSKVTWILWRFVLSLKVLYLLSIRQSQNCCVNLLKMLRNYWNIYLGGRISKFNSSKNQILLVCKY